MKMQRVNLSPYSMKLCIEPRSDCSLGLECFHSSEFIFVFDFYPRENWSLGRIYPWLGFYPRFGVYHWLGFYPWVGLDPWLGFHPRENWSLGRIEASVEFYPR